MMKHNSNPTRQEKIAILKDILHGKRTLASLNNTAIPILMVNPDMPGRYFDRNGREYIEAELANNSARIVIHLPTNHREAYAAPITPESKMSPYKTKNQ